MVEIQSLEVAERELELDVRFHDLVPLPAFVAYGPWLPAPVEP